MSGTGFRTGTDPVTCGSLLHRRCSTAGVSSPVSLKVRAHSGPGPTLSVGSTTRRCCVSHCGAGGHAASPQQGRPRLAVSGKLSGWCEMGCCGSTSMQLTRHVTQVCTRLCIPACSLHMQPTPAQRTLHVWVAPARVWCLSGFTHRRQASRQQAAQRQAEAPASAAAACLGGTGAHPSCTTPGCSTSRGRSSTAPSHASAHLHSSLGRRWVSGHLGVKPSRS